tara:strand:- start:511 stop:1140 length:630 start_codon:yes stop_codon:yes gene_type:complete
MALTGKKYSDIHNKTGDELIDIRDKFNDGFQELFSANPDLYPEMAAIIYQIQLMQEELDYLRTEISNNKDKATFPGLGTSGSTALAGDTTTISTAQASAITANTAKTGITLQEQKDISNNKAGIANNVSEISNNKTSIGLNNAAAINVGAYPALPPFAPVGTTQSHASEMVYDKTLKKYFLNIYYIEDTPAIGGKKGQRIIKTGQVELK